MNIVELHYKTVFFLDSVNSPRFTLSKKDEAINSAIMDIVLDRYDNIRAQQKQYAFQTSQRLRDELYTIVKHPAVIVASGGIIPKTSFPSDYMLLLSMKANVSGQWINTIPATYDEVNVLELNPFTHPSIIYPERIYRIENSEGVEVIFGDVGALVSGDINYMAKPVTVSIGTEVGINEWVYLSDSPSVIAYVDSTVQLILSGGPVWPPIPIKKNEEYIIGTNSEVSITLITGILFKDYTNTDLPVMLHEEMSRKAAQILSGNVENYNRSQALEQDIKNTEN